jgi:hypothetical protein
MAALRTVTHLLAWGVIFAASADAATPADGAAGAWPAPAVAAGALLPDERPANVEALLQLVHGNRFCRWYPRHHLCFKLVVLRRFCDRHPNHHMCEDPKDRFCRRHPNHRRCDDQPPSPS